MDEATRNEILTRVDALAERLGTTAEYLRSSIVQDVMVRGWALFAGCALIAVLLLIVAKRLAPKLRDLDAVDQVPLALAIACLFCGACVSLGLALNYLSQAVAPRLEAWRVLIGG